jgi:hypothetical protein
MKEIELNNADKLEISVKQKKQIEKKFIGDIVPHNGHKMWKINQETLEIEEVKYSNTAYQIGANNKKEILVLDGFWYVSALNKKNALKLFIKGKIGGKEIDKNPLKFII